MSGHLGTFVLVDRNAIYNNDHDGTDHPPLVVHSGDSGCSAAHELVVRDVDGRVVARFRSQSLRRPVRGDRPHVWFELETGSLELVTAGK
jgi:hypothetical protein